MCGIYSYWGYRCVPPSLLICDHVRQCCCLFWSQWQYLREISSREERFSLAHTCPGSTGPLVPGLQGGRLSWCRANQISHGWEQTETDREGAGNKMAISKGDCSHLLPPRGPQLLCLPLSPWECESIKGPILWGEQISQEQERRNQLPTILLESRPSGPCHPNLKLALHLRGPTASQ